MKLQELLRNIVLFKGMDSPLQKTRIELLFDRFAKQNYLADYQKKAFHLPEAMKTSFMADRNTQTKVRIGEVLLTEISGTRTISYFNSDKYDRSVTGNNISIMLTKDFVHECIAGSSKTYFQTRNIRMKLSTAFLSKTMNRTTGYAIGEKCFFIPEIHEKREYLGEFSLPREEALVMYFRKEVD